MSLKEFSRSFLEHPEWLDLSVFVVAVAAVCIALAKYLERRRRRRMPENSSLATSASWVSDTALLVSLAAVCVALLGPRIGERTVLMVDRATDVVFLIDVSRSMSATDVPPTRLDRARRAVEAMLGRLQAGDRAALAVFANRGLLLTPLTPDRNALIDLLADVGPGLIETASSNIGAGIGAALTAFETASDHPRVIVVASDGEDSKHGGDLGAAAAAQQNARIVALAVGTDAGGHIPEAGGVYRSRAGEPVLTQRDADRLGRLAAATDGRIFLGDEWGHFDFDLAAADVIRRDSAVAGEPTERRVPAIQVIPFAALAFAILLLEGALPSKRLGPGRESRRPRGRRRRIVAGTALVMTLGVVAGLITTAPAKGVDSSALPTPAEIRKLENSVQRSPENSRARIRLGIAYLAIGSGADAVREFLAATIHARDPEVAATAYFDLGVARLEQDELLRARDAFFDALVLSPTDERARFNLEWTLALLRHESDTMPAPLGKSDHSATPDERSSAESNATKPTPSQTGAIDSAGPARRLSADERRQWLARVSDDSRNWLRAAANETHDLSDPDRDPAW